MRIVVCNIGSTSFKFQLIDMAGETVMARGSAERVGAPVSRVTYWAEGDRSRIDEIPLHPEKIFNALRNKERGKAARVGPDSVPQIDYPEAVKVESQWGQPADS